MKNNPNDDSNQNLLKSYTRDNSINMLETESENNSLINSNEEEAEIILKHNKSNEKESQNNLKESSNTNNKSNSNLDFNNNYNSDLNSIIINPSMPKIDWRQEALIGNFMPAVIKLDRKEITVNDIVDSTTENRLIHLTSFFSYLNVTRCLIEIFECEIDLKNGLGQTPLHIICNNQEYQDVYLFSYLIKNDFINVNMPDKSGMTPIFYSITSKFNLAILGLVHKKADLNHIENMGNNIFYFALTSDNKFAMKFLIRHMSGFDINQKYYKKQANLADIIITTKNTQCLKHLAKYHHLELEINSIFSCQKDFNDFKVYNKFNYDLLNTIYYYKSKNYFGFFKAILNRNITTNNNMNNTYEKFIHTYSYKIYNLSFFFYYLMLKNTSRKLKLFFIWTYSIILSIIFYLLNHYVNENSKNYSDDLFTFQTLIYIWQMSSIFTLFYSMFKFSIKKYKNDFYEEIQFNLQYNSRDNVCAQIYEAMERNPLDLFFEEEICEVCLIRKDKDTNHCHSCNKCVREFYFHSNLFDMCFNRNNIHVYIIFLTSLASLSFCILMMMYYIIDIEFVKNNNNLIDNTIYTSNYFTTNLIFFLINSTVDKLICYFILFVSGVLFLQKAMTMIICYGYKTTYYNMFRMHKRSVGVIQQRGNMYYNIPQMNLISLIGFIKNLIWS